MSATEIGIFGETYEDRKSKKRGRLLCKDVEHNSVILIAEDGSQFLVTLPNFRNNWRKVSVVEVNIPAEEAEVIDTENDRKEEKPMEDKKEVKVDTSPVTEFELNCLKEFLNWRKNNVVGSDNKELESIVDRLSK